MLQNADQQRSVAPRRSGHAGTGEVGANGRGAAVALAHGDLEGDASLFIDTLRDAGVATLLYRPFSATLACASTGALAFLAEVERAGGVTTPGV